MEREIVFVEVNIVTGQTVITMWGCTECGGAVYDREIHTNYHLVGR